MPFRKRPIFYAKKLLYVLEMGHGSAFHEEDLTDQYVFLFNLFLGEYSCLSVDLVFKRQFSYYLITIYVPGCMLVVVSWVSFWLDPHAVPARVALGVTTLLTMSTQTASINSALPPVAYTKAIDVWQVSNCQKGYGLNFNFLKSASSLSFVLRVSALHLCSQLYLNMRWSTMRSELTDLTCCARWRVAAGQVIPFSTSAMMMTVEVGINK